MACSSADDLWIVKPVKVRHAVYRADELNSKYQLLLLVVAELAHSSRSNLACQ